MAQIGCYFEDKDKVGGPQLFFELLKKSGYWSIIIVLFFYKGVSFIMSIPCYELICPPKT